MTTIPNAATSQRILILGTAGDAAVQAIEFMEDLGLEPAIIDSPSVETLDPLRDAAFALVLPADEADAGGMMMAVGFMLAALGRARICLLAPADQVLPPALDGATRIAPDDGGLWRLLLARELKRAGLDVDLNRAL
jgi:hypothetical protein